MSGTSIIAKIFTSLSTSDHLEGNCSQYKCLHEKGGISSNGGFNMVMITCDIQRNMSIVTHDTNLNL